MDKPHYFKPRFPPRHPVMEESIGRFILVWGVLEQQLDSGLSAILCIDATLALTISANLGTKAKVDILHSAISMSRDLVDEPLRERAHTALNVISNLSGRHRNALAHGQALHNPEEKGWRWHRVSARKELDVTLFSAPATRWVRAATEVRKATREWCTAYQAIWIALEAVPREKRDDAYHYVPKFD